VSGPDCTFCALIAGRLPASLIAHSERSLAFCDLRQPHAEGAGAHVLVVPRAHVETLDRLSPADAADLLQLAVRLAAALREEFGDEGLSMWQSNGVGAFQEVPHVHLHLLTRRVGDRLLQVYADTVPAPADRAALDILAGRLARLL